MKREILYEVIKYVLFRSVKTQSGADKVIILFGEDTDQCRLKVRKDEVQAIEKINNSNICNY